MEILSIGRDAINQIVLSDNFVSRKHAQLTVSDNGQVMIKDLGSSNGTFVNGVRVNECHLKQGDVVKCASALLNWQQYALSSPFKTSKPVPASSLVMVKQTHSNQVEDNRNISSASPDLTPKSINEALAAQNQPQINTYSPVQQNVIVVGKAKSVGTAFILSFFFGPFGLLYASVTGGIIMIILYIPILIITLGIGALFIHPICAVWAIIAANQANASLQNKAGGLINNNFQN